MTHLDLYLSGVTDANFATVTKSRRPRSAADSAMADDPARPLSRSEETLVRFLNTPFAVAMPALLAILAGMLWTFHSVHFGVRQFVPIDDEDDEE